MVGTILEVDSFHWYHSYYSPYDYTNDRNFLILVPRSNLSRVFLCILLRSPRLLSHTTKYRLDKIVYP